MAILLWMFLKNRVLRCFAVFCGVLRCFVCVFLAFFTKQTKKYTKRTKRTKYALCNTAQYVAVHLSLTQKNVYKKNRKIRPKHCKTHRKTLFFKNTRKTPQNTRKTPAIHFKTPQNTTKHIC